MDAQSPPKRRALASLDANAQSTRPLALASSPGKANLLLQQQQQRKRTHDEAVQSPLKRTCIDPTPDVLPSSRDRSRDVSLSPPASEADNSIFDISAGDSSWATTTTEPDQLAPVTRRRELTREQVREKVNILRARLGLAGYKVRTGQLNVSLTELERNARPLKTIKVLPDNAVPATSSTRGVVCESRQPKRDENDESNDVAGKTSIASEGSDAAAAAANNGSEKAEQDTCQQQKIDEEKEEEDDEGTPSGLEHSTSKQKTSGEDRTGEDIAKAALQMAEMTNLEKE